MKIETGKPMTPEQDNTRAAELSDAIEALQSQIKPLRQELRSIRLRQNTRRHRAKAKLASQ